MPIDIERVRATIYGGAIGDSLGLSAEYLPASEVIKMYPEGGPKEFEAVDRNVFGMREVWEAGNWSDDTDCSLAILDAFLECPKGPFSALTKAFARHLVAWKDRNARGMGRHTRTVLESPGFTEDPLLVSEQAWLNRPTGSVPANGGVMRTAVVGLLRPWDLNWTEEAAVQFCQTTHWGSECVASSVAVSFAVASLVMDSTASQAIETAQLGALPYDRYLPVLLHPDSDIRLLRLDEGLPITKGVPVLVGHTYKTTQAGFWALLTAARLRVIRTSPRQRFRKCLEAVIREGGDADTNGAVVGSMLGAYEGWDGIPEALAEGIKPKEELDSRIARLIATYPISSTGV